MSSLLVVYQTFLFGDFACQVLCRFVACSFNGISTVLGREVSLDTMCVQPQVPPYYQGSAYKSTLTGAQICVFSPPKSRPSSPHH